MATAKQLAARRKFAAAVRAGAFKNPGRRRVRKNEFSTDIVTDAEAIKKAGRAAAKAARDAAKAAKKAVKAARETTVATKKKGKKKGAKRAKAVSRKTRRAAPRTTKRAVAPRKAKRVAKRMGSKARKVLMARLRSLKKAYASAPKRSHKRRAIHARYVGLSVRGASKSRRWKKRDRTYVAKHVRVNARRRRGNPRRRFNPFSPAMVKKAGAGLVTGALVLFLGKKLGDMVRPSLPTSMEAVKPYTTALVSAVVTAALYFGIKKVPQLAMLRPFAMPIAIGGGAAAVLHAVGPQVPFLSDNFAKLGLPLGDYVSLPPAPLHAYVDRDLSAYREVSGLDGALGDDAMLLEAVRDGGSGQSLPGQDEHTRALLEAASAGGDAKDGQWEESVLLSAINGY